MPTILTPKRRRLNRSASKVIDAMVDAWRWRTGASSTNTMMGLGIRCGMLHQELMRLAFEQDALPRGVLQVPHLPPTPPGAGGFSVSGGMSGFTVDLDDLWQGPPPRRLWPAVFGSSDDAPVEPDWSTRRHETWCGMTQAEMDAWIEERRVEREKDQAKRRLEQQQQNFLHVWKPPTLRN